MPSFVARTELIASRALPGSGAFYTPSSPFEVPQGIGTVVVWVTYTRGGAGGYPVLRPLLGNGTETAYDALMSPSVTVVAPFGTQPSNANTIAFPAPADGSAVTLAYTFTVAGVLYFNLTVAEVGATGTPGTIAVALTGGV